VFFKFRCSSNQELSIRGVRPWGKYADRANVSWCSTRLLADSHLSLHVTLAPIWSTARRRHKFFKFRRCMQSVTARSFVESVMSHTAAREHQYDWDTGVFAI